MSDVKRYLAKMSWTQIETQEHPNGEFVLHSDYARLKAEIERLRHLEGVASSVDFYQQENAKLNKDIERLAMIKDACKRMIKRRDKWIFERRAENARLKAEVERLRKAGDYMADHLAHEFGTCPSIEVWNAAKEGKPSV